MKILRKLLSLILILGLCITLIPPVQAAVLLSTQEKADILSAISILAPAGETGYRLGDPLPRKEAATLFIKILGKQSFVQNNKEEYRFTDFPDVDETQWYAPYAGYCNLEGLMSGYPDGKFWPDRIISEKAFLTVVLKILGYESKVDFTWDTVYAKAYEVGLVKISTYKTQKTDKLNYTRGDMVTALYNALTVKMKKTGTKLAYSLVDNGVTTLDAIKAEGIVEDAVETGLLMVSAMSQDKVQVFFNENVTAGESTLVKVFETGKPENVLTATIEIKTPNLFIIKTSTQSSFSDYTLQIENLSDEQGNKAALLSKEFMGFMNSEVKSDFFRISKVEAISRNTINVYFTHPLNINSEIASYYEILVKDITVVKGSSKSIAAKLLKANGNCVTLILKDTVLEQDKYYTLKVSGDLGSLYGVRLNEGTADAFKFVGKANETEQLKITGVTALSSNSLKVDFNNFLDPFFAQQFLNYSVSGPSNISLAVNKAVLESEGDRKGKTVYLNLLGALDKTRQYSLYINYLTDTTKQNMLTEANYLFNGSYPNQTDLSISSVQTVDKGTLLVNFQRQVNAATAVTNSFYQISGVTDTGYYSMPAKALPNGAVVKLFLPADKILSGSKTYRLTVLSVMQDYLGNTSTRNMEFIFTANNTEYVKPMMTDAVAVSKDTIKLSFNREIAEEAPNLSTANYLLEYLEDGAVIGKIPNNVTYIDPFTMVLRFDALKSDIKYSVKFKTLKDYAGVNSRTAMDGSNSIVVRVGQ
jgi:hypothetical protein